MCTSSLNVHVIQRRFQILKSFPRYVGIDFRCSGTSVPQQGLDIPQIRPPFQQMGNKTVSKAVQRYVLLNSGLLQCPLEYFSETGGTVLTALGALKEPFLWAVLLVIIPQERQGSKRGQVYC